MGRTAWGVDGGTRGQVQGRATTVARFPGRYATVARNAGRTGRKAHYRGAVPRRRRHGGATAERDSRRARPARPKRRPRRQPLPPHHPRNVLRVGKRPQNVPWVVLRRPRHPQNVLRVLSAALGTRRTFCGHSPTRGRVRQRKSPTKVTAVQPLMVGQKCPTIGTKVSGCWDKPPGHGRAVLAEPQPQTGAFKPSQQRGHRRSGAMHRKEASESGGPYRQIRTPARIASVDA